MPRRTIECDEMLELNGLLIEDRVTHQAIDLL